MPVNRSRSKGRSSPGEVQPWPRIGTTTSLSFARPAASVLVFSHLDLALRTILSVLFATQLRLVSLLIYVYVCHEDRPEGHGSARARTDALCTPAIHGPAHLVSPTAVFRAAESSLRTLLSRHRFLKKKEKKKGCGIRRHGLARSQPGGRTCERKQSG